MAGKLDNVIIQINLEESRAKAKIEQFNRQLKTSGNFSARYKNIVQETQAEERKLDAIQGRRTKHLETLGQSTKGLGDKMKQTSKSTGGAATSVLELGRVVSDAPYGIRGMANNVSQLSSNMLFAAQQIDKTTGKAVGFGNVVRGMGKSFMGPLGILFAIQAVVAALDFFFGGMKKAEDASKKLGEETGKSVGEFMRVNDILQDNRNSLEQKTEALRVLKKEYPKATKLADFYTEAIESGNTEINKAIKLEKEFTKTIIKEAKQRAGVKLIQKEAENFLTLNDEREEDIKKLKKYLIEKSSVLTESNRDILKSNIESLKSNFDVSKSFNDQSEDVKKAYTSLSTFGKFAGISRKKIISFRKALEKNRKEIEKSEKKITRLSDTTKNFFPDSDKVGDELSKKLAELADSKLKREIIVNESIIDNDKITNLKKIELLEKNHKLSLQLFQNERDASDKDLGKSKSDLAQRAVNFNDFKNKRTKAEKSLRDDIRALKVDRDKVELFELDEAGIDDAKKRAKKLLKIIADGLGEDMKKDPLQVETTLDLELSDETKASIATTKAKIEKEFAAKLVRDSQIEDFVSYAEKAKEILSAINDFTDAEFERELAIEQNKTNLLNNELKQRLQNENLSKDQRQAIQDKIAQNDEKLRVKQEAIEKKRFKMQKAANMATAIINTALAATGVLKDTKGGSFARIAGMIAVIGSGLAQVATISRQKFQTSAGSSPSVAGGSNGNISNISNSGGGDRAEPAFNIVGMGANNQLLEAIQAQFDKPLRAYVVSREVTRQQNLDASIKTGAGI